MTYLTNHHILKQYTLNVIVNRLRALYSLLRPESKTTIATDILTRPPSLTDTLNSLFHNPSNPKIKNTPLLQELKQIMTQRGAVPLPMFAKYTFILRSTHILAKTKYIHHPPSNLPPPPMNPLEDISDEITELDHHLDLTFTDTKDRPQIWSTRPKSKSRYQRGSRKLQAFSFEHTPSAVEDYIDISSPDNDLDSAVALLSCSSDDLEIAHCKIIIPQLQAIIRTNRILASYLPDLSLEPIYVIPDGRCLFYAVNAAHYASSNINDPTHKEIETYIHNHFDLRLIACTLARDFLLLPNNPLYSPLILHDLELSLSPSHETYPEIIYLALASLRNGPITIIREDGNMNTYSPDPQMLKIAFGSVVDYITRHDNIYLLHRTSCCPHFDATRKITKYYQHPDTPAQSLPHHASESSDTLSSSPDNSAIFDEDFPSSPLTPPPSEIPTPPKSPVDQTIQNPPLIMTPAIPAQNPDPPTPSQTTPLPHHSTPPPLPPIPTPPDSTKSRSPPPYLKLPYPEKPNPPANISLPAATS